VSAALDCYRLIIHDWSLIIFSIDSPVRKAVWVVIIVRSGDSIVLIFASLRIYQDSQLSHSFHRCLIGGTWRFIHIISPDVQVACIVRWLTLEAGPSQRSASNVLSPRENTVGCINYDLRNTYILSFSEVSKSGKTELSLFMWYWYNPRSNTDKVCCWIND
jgi:hypothetical protein